VWAGRHVTLGVSGGIAAYKSCILVRRLVEAGAKVDVILTEGAAEFVRPLTFEALSGRPVITSLWEPGTALQHIRLAQSPDLIIVAPGHRQSHRENRSGRGRRPAHRVAAGPNRARSAGAGNE
jgi:phosphopantothenoylcysteine synthetase/decarboxylase